MTTSLPRSHNDERMAITLTGGNQAASTSIAPTDLGDNTPLGWFPNLVTTKLARLTQLKLAAVTAADRDLLKTAAAGQEFGLIVTARAFDNNDPATGDVVNEKAVTAIITKDANDNRVDWWKNPDGSDLVCVLPNDFDAEELNIQIVVPTTTGSQPSGMKIYAS